jgi:geranylgeranyl reductase family protein
VPTTVEPDLDVLVVGAGPAGVAAAVTAHQRGLRVACLDRATFPRDKTCGDGLTASALRLLEDLGVAVPAIASTQPVTTVVLRAPNGRISELPLPRDGHHAVVTTRRDLDAALVARARAVGVAVHEGRSVTGLEVTRTGAVVAHGNGDGTVATTARFVIAADGHYSTVRRLAAPESERDLGSWHAFRQYFRGVGDDRLWVLFEADLLPGYAWVFPLPGGRANVGFGVLRHEHTTGKQLAALWRDLLERPALRDVLGPRAEPEAPHRAWPIPGAFDPRRATAGRVLFAGDAAGVVDPMTGEGIAQALESGMVAARAIADAKIEGRPVAAVDAAYRRALDHALGRDLRFAHRLQYLLRSPATTSGVLALVNATPWTRRNFARWMFEDYPRALAITPGRWRRGVFTPPGSFSAGAYADAAS